jgi:serralysin
MIKSASESMRGAADVIADSSKGQDRLDFSGFDAHVNGDGREGFSWIGTAAFAGQAGQLQFCSHGGHTHVRVTTAIEPLIS